MLKYILLVLIVGGFLGKSCCSSLKLCHDSKKLKGYTVPPVLYHDVESVIRVLQEPKHYSIKAVQKLLKFYYKARDKRAKFEADGGTKKYPLIVVEGLSGTGKTTISVGLARILNATHCHTPSRNLKKYKLKADLKKNRVIYNAYHQLAQYITGEEVYPLLQDAPVVLDRYWHSAATFSIARSVFVDPEIAMPPKGDKIYNWPDDLLKPDIVMYLEVDEDVRYQRMTKSRVRLGGNELLLHKSPEYRNNVILAYKNMQNPGVTVIDDSLPIPEVMNQVLEKVKPFFKNDTSLSFEYTSQKIGNKMTRKKSRKGSKDDSREQRSRESTEQSSRGSSEQSSRGSSEQSSRESSEQSSRENSEQSSRGSSVQTSLESSEES